jgi:hypothetical protein
MRDAPLDVGSLRGYACGMSQSARKQDDSPEVAALRKKIRGEALTDDERACLMRVSRKPPEVGVPLTQEQVEALLAERARARE